MNERLLFARYVVCTFALYKYSMIASHGGAAESVVILFFSYDSKSQTLVERNGVSRRINRGFNGRMKGEDVVEKGFP